MKSNDHSVCLILLGLLLSQIANSFATEAIFNRAGGALSSSQLVAAVLVANPQLEVVQAVWQASVNRIEQESALDDPMLVHSMAPQTIGAQQRRTVSRRTVSGLAIKHCPIPSGCSQFYFE